MFLGKMHELVMLAENTESPCVREGWSVTSRPPETAVPLSVLQPRRPHTPLCSSASCHPGCLNVLPTCPVYLGLQDSVLANLILVLPFLLSCWKLTF